MKNRGIQICLLGVCLLSGFETSSALGEGECPIAQSGYECYCPPDTTLPCENIPLPSYSNPSDFGNSSARVTPSMLLVGGGDNSANGSTNVTLRSNFLRNIQVYFMGLLGIVSVGVFIYIGYTLFTARGNEEDFKNAWKALIYAVIGLAVMPLAYVAVKIITGYTF